MSIIAYALINSMLRILLTILLTVKLVRFGDMLNPLERFGMGLMGGASFMTIALIWDVNRLGTPFDGWASTLLTTGALVYFSGRMTRHIRHRKRNLEQERIAQDYFNKR